jgi:hypothetical protein
MHHVYYCKIFSGNWIVLSFGSGCHLVGDKELFPYYM